MLCRWIFTVPSEIDSARRSRVAQPLRDHPDDLDFARRQHPARLAHRRLALHAPGRMRASSSRGRSTARRDRRAARTRSAFRATTPSTRRPARRASPPRTTSSSLIAAVNRRPAPALLGRHGLSTSRPVRPGIRRSSTSTSQVVVARRRDRPGAVDAAFDDTKAGCPSNSRLRP